MIRHVDIEVIPTIQIHFLFRPRIHTVKAVSCSDTIDGANEFYIFHRIVFPMLRNAVASMAIFQFLWAWEDYLWPYLMIRSESKQLLSIALNMFSGCFSTDYAGLFAATSIAIIPVVLCYLVFQKRFIEGIASSAVKG